MRLVVNLLFTLVLFLAFGLFPAVRAGGASPPVISVQPTNITLRGGFGGALSLAAGGDPAPDYQWYFEDSILPGFTNSVLTIYRSSTSQQGDYFAVVSNTVGSVTSSVATITVITNPPSFLSQSSNTTVTVGQNVTLSVTSTGLPPPSYTWWFNETSHLNFPSRQLPLIPARETNSGTYTVVLSNSVSSVTSAPIVLTVSALPLMTVQPANQTLIESDPLTLHVAAIGRTPLHYRWFFQDTALAGATATNFIVPAVYPTNSGGYYCVVSNSAGVTTSAVAAITVIPAPTSPGSHDLHYKPNTNGWRISDLILLEDDKLLAAGEMVDAGLRRLNVDGTVDSTFRSNRSFVAKIALQPDAKILAAFGSQLVRLNSSGVQDTNFMPWFFTLPNTIHDLGVQPDGGIIYVGYDNSGTLNHLGRFLPNGTQDPFFKTFDPAPLEGGVGGGNSGEIKTLAVLPNGSFLFPGLPLQRRHPDGTVDWSFAMTTSDEGRLITAIIPTPDERAFYIMGTFTNIGSAVRRSVARLDYNGALDTTFVPPTNLLGTVTAAAVQTDGKVIVAGFVVAGSNAIIRLNLDGSVDETFTPALMGQPGPGVNALAIQSDGRILAGGGFIRVNGRRIHGLARLYGDPPGPPEIVAQPEDASVTVGQNVSLHATVHAFGSQSYQWFRNGELISTGKAPVLRLQALDSSHAGDYQLVASTSYGSVTSRVARLSVEPNPETPGSIALTAEFNVDGAVYAIAPAPNGRQIIAGNFHRVDGVPRAGLARVNADGSLDTTFNPPETAPRDAFRYVRALAVTPEGSVYIGGSFTNIGGVPRQLVARLRDDGTLDEEFDPATALRGPESSQVNAIALQADGKVLVAGSFTSTSNLFSGGAVARLHANGRVDTNFLHGLSGEATCLAVINTNAILVGGTLRAFGGFVPIAGIYRLRDNGAQELGLLTGFLCDIRSGVRSIVALPNGKILVGGGFTVPRTNGTSVARLMANGMLDPTFNPGIRVERCSWIADAGCGKVLIGGSFGDVNGQPHRNVARLNSDGTLDTTFDSQPFDGAVTTGFVSPNGDAIVAGEFFTAKGMSRLHVARINNGPYELPVVATQPITQSVAEGASASLRTEIFCTFPPPTFQWQLNGANLLGETNSTLNTANTRLTQDGSYRLILSNAVGVVTSSVAQLTVMRAPREPGAPEIETTSIFSSNSVVRALQVLPDGKVLVGGSFSNMFGVRHRGLFRLNADATLDHTFGYAGTNEVRALALCTDGRIVINESAPPLGTIPGNTRILRLHPNGTIDTSFANSPYYLHAWNEYRLGPRSMVIDSSNQVYVSRETDIIRLPGGWTKAINGTVYAMAFQPDGKLLLAGAFSGVSDVPQTNLARLQTNGLVDRPFVPWAGALYCMALQPDGKIVVGGQFTSAGGLIRRGIARFHGDGTLDEEFSPHPGVGGANPTVLAVALQPDGKVIIGGTFSSYDGVPCSNLARLNPNGTLDHTFQPGTGIRGGPNPVVNVIALVNDGGIFVGGSFNTFNDVPRHSLARAYNNPKVVNFSRDETFTEFSFLSLLDRTYILESKSIAENSPWMPVRSVIGDGTIKSITYSNATPDALLYRLRVE